MGDASKYEGLISVLKNDNVDVRDILDILLDFTGATNVSLFTKTGRLISTNDTLHDVSVFKRTRFVIGLDKATGGGVESVNPFLNAIEGILDDDIDGTSFIVNMSHEIRTPLNGVHGYTQLLSQTSMNKQQRYYLKSLMDCSVQLMEIINNVLDASRLNSCKMDIKEGVFSLKEVETSTECVVSERLKSNNQTLKWRYGSEIPNYIVSDKQKMVQIMINLISNASKYSDKGTSIQVILGCEGGIIKIQVVDDGIGIPESKQHLLFSPFARLHPESIQTGSGLGLSICKRLAILLNGDLTAVSREGKGSVFTLTVPYDTPSTPDEVIDINIDKLVGIEVYVVSDKVKMRLDLMEYFDTWSANTTAFATPDEVKHVSKRETKLVDVLLLETSMGVDRIEEIRMCHPLAYLFLIGDNEQGVCCDGIINYPLCKPQVYEKVVEIIETTPRRKSGSPPSVKIYDTIKVLICEDVEYNRDILSSLLAEIGITNIDFAVDGEKAIDIIDKSKISGRGYDIIFMDLKMPRVDGYEVIEYINDTSVPNGTSAPKIIVTTASVISGELERCSKMGVDRFLSKPISLHELKRQIIATLGEK